MAFPATVSINAWGPDGDSTSPLDPGLPRRILAERLLARPQDLPAVLADPKDWRHPDVGWGLVLPENLALPAADRATAIDAAEPIRALHAARGSGPVFRVGAGWRPGTLRRYAADGAVMDVAVGAQMVGTGPGRIPRYLLLVGSPAEIPWEVQYDLHQTFYVGRLDLPSDGLARYVDALLTDWAANEPDPAQTLGWSVDHGGGDITTLMAATVGTPMHQRFANDPDAALRAGARFLTGHQATHAGLAAAIAAARPALITTTSHGATTPLTDTAAMRAGLGLLVDADFAALDPGLLTGDAAPGGAVWFAQACCSAGSAARSAYVGLVTEGSRVDRVLKAVADCGDTTAPLPRALLGGARPLRAFVGHVEPTFDWTLRHPETHQFMTMALLNCFYQALFTGAPIGMALQSVRATAGSIFNSYDLARQILSSTGDTAQLGPILALQLMARDWRSIVLLGDPTCRVPQIPTP